MWSSRLSLASIALFLTQGQCSCPPLDIPAPAKNIEAVPRDYQSFSIEFTYFPDYAGNKSNPNVFSKNLLANFKDITGVNPKLRIGGNSQDNSDYFPEQKENIKLIFKNPGDDQPEKAHYGPSYFESYQTLGDIQFIHGLNMKQNDSRQLRDAAVGACTSLGSNLHLFELGNEWNFGPGIYLAANYSIQDYVQEWKRKSDVVLAGVQKACPGPFPGFMAPSFLYFASGLFNQQFPWKAEDLYKLGYDPKNLTKEISFHTYMNAFLPPLPPAAMDLQETFMNHTNIVENLAPQIQRAKNLAHLGHPFTLDEMNSMAGQGRNGVTDVFGIALWLVDFSLWAAANNIKRLHFHQALNYRYTSWQPILSKGIPPATRAPYYGQVMVASAFGRSKNARVANIPLSGDKEAAYGIYEGKKLSKLVVLNLQTFNQTAFGNRLTREYKFNVPRHTKRVKIERLIAPGSDSTGNITFGGISYDYGLKRGKPTLVDAKEKNQFVKVKNGVLRVDVPDSSAVLLTLL
ncbi:uncharacterized protein N7479_010578 [Penicillium vulpinum]|uniref:Beta-glucuronidase C-terminal domain-containing protein n=1 Tax=Penicillium vulpinum TaxID=29845 RepID=A0A1V6S9T5_9EURO|nr:uncharacterized protein N7479_010578 [Penicillium vulpinum]KAJ5952165.1 hypothetical protein N7479_010578 [Penicillium vulpinum]OQE10484.1 hypothetical protein PENVUL_c004G02432 [Penicillium vulpinum]